MSEQSHSQKAKKNKVIQPKTAPEPQPTLNNEVLPEAMNRMKDINYPQVNLGDLLSLQQGVGNKAFRNLVAQRFFDPILQPLQRHSIPESREGVGEDEEEIQRQVEGGALQRHSMPEGREGVGEEEDEVQTMPVIQRSTAFGRMGNRATTTSSLLWGNGTSLHLQRKNGESKGYNTTEGEIKTGGKTKTGEGSKKVEDQAADAKKLPTEKKEVKADDPSVKVAEDEYKKFTAGGPYRINPYVPDQVDNFGKFESIYDPANRTLTADMRVKFVFPDLPIPEGDSVADKTRAPLVKMIHEMYKQNFISQVHKGWSGKFNFQNVREPQGVWGKLNPITVKVNVQPVDSNQHYLIKGYFNKSGTANVTSNTAAKNNPSPSTLTLFKGDLDPMNQSFTNNPTTGAEEVKRLERNLPKIHFANGSMTIDQKYLPDLQYVADYLKQMNRPKFFITVIGHANKTGNEKNNIKYSATRAQVVLDKLKALGITNHVLSSTGIGSTGATEDGSWRKVDFSISVDKSFTNVQDTTLHEFGHMLGLDDEYVRSKDTRTHTTQKDFMAKMLGNEVYGKGSEGKLGEELTSVLPLSSASVMESGDEVRPYHYVTLWQALYDTAAKAANQPTPPFTWQDWKVSGY